MINVLVIMLEGITAWLCLHSVFGEKIRKSYKEIIFYLLYVALFLICYKCSLNNVFSLFIFALSVVWAKWIFGLKIKNTIIRGLLGIIVLGIFETLGMFLTTPIVAFINNVQIKCIVIGIMSVICALSLYWFIIYKKHRKEKIVFDNLIEICILIFFLFLVMLKIEFELNKRISIVFVSYFLILAMAFGIVYKKQKSIYLLEKQKLNLELQSIYGTAYEELLQEVRRKQHDYKNQLAAICGMHITAGSMEELIDLQEKYIKVLEKEGDADSILTKCNNPILAGYVYNIYAKLRKDGCNFETDILVNNKDVGLKTKDTIEILGVLLNNAYEYVAENFANHKEIKLFLHENREKTIIEVINISAVIPYSQIETMFELGFSTKGEDRGIGLYSVKNIVKKYSGNILVDNYHSDGDNWTKFKVEF